MGVLWEKPGGELLFREFMRDTLQDACTHVKAFRPSAERYFPANTGAGLPSAGSKPERTKRSTTLALRS